MALALADAAADAGADAVADAAAARWRGESANGRPIGVTIRHKRQSDTLLTTNSGTTNVRLGVWLSTFTLCRAANSDAANVLVRNRFSTTSLELNFTRYTVAVRPTPNRSVISTF